MADLTKRAAAKLVADIRRTRVAGIAIAQRTGRGAEMADCAFLGGLEVALQAFLREHGCHEAAEALPDAMNRPPTEAELAVRVAQLEALVKPGKGGAHA